MTTYRFDGFKVRTLQEWRGAVILSHVQVLPSMTKRKWDKHGKYIPPHRVDGYTVVSLQDWRKTCRDFAMVHGVACVVFADDTVSEFIKHPSGRIRMTRRKPARIITTAIAA